MLVTIEPLGGAAPSGSPNGTEGEEKILIISFASVAEYALIAAWGTAKGAPGHPLPHTVPTATLYRDDRGCRKRRQRTA